MGEFPYAYGVLYLELGHLYRLPGLPRAPVLNRLGRPAPSECIAMASSIFVARDEASTLGSMPGAS